MKDVHPRVVLTEKSPFWVTVIITNSPAYGKKFLVKPCTSEKDIEVLYQDEFENKSTIKGFRDYYIVLKGVDFANNLVYKSICERIRK